MAQGTLNKPARAMNEEVWNDRLYGAKTPDEVPDSIAKTDTKVGAYLVGDRMFMNFGEIKYEIPNDVRHELYAIAGHYQDFGLTPDNITILRTAAVHGSPWANELAAIADKAASSVFGIAPNAG